MEAKPDFHNYHALIKKGKRRVKYPSTDLEAIHELIDRYYAAVYKDVEVSEKKTQKDLELLQNDIREYMAGSMESSKPIARYILGIYTYENPNQGKSPEAVETIRFFITKRLAGKTNIVITADELVELGDCIYKRQILRPLVLEAPTESDKQTILELAQEVPTLADLLRRSGIRSFEDVVKVVLKEKMAYEGITIEITELKLLWFPTYLGVYYEVRASSNIPGETPDTEKGEIYMERDSRFFYKSKLYPFDFSPIGYARQAIWRLHLLDEGLHDEIVAKLSEITGKPVTSFYQEDGYVKVGYEEYFRLPRKVGPHEKEEQREESSWFDRLKRNRRSKK